MRGIFASEPVGGSAAAGRLVPAWATDAEQMASGVPSEASAYRFAVGLSRIEKAVGRSSSSSRWVEQVSQVGGGGEERRKER